MTAPTLTTKLDRAFFASAKLRRMNGDEDCVYDEGSGEWMAASELAAKQAADDRVEVRDEIV